MKLLLRSYRNLPPKGGQSHRREFERWSVDTLYLSKAPFCQRCYNGWSDEDSLCDRSAASNGNGAPLFRTKQNNCHQGEHSHSKSDLCRCRCCCFSCRAQVIRRQVSACRISMRKPFQLVAISQKKRTQFWLNCCSCVHFKRC